ncbi:MAG: hypothetical protein JWN85_3353 [Gammaproteobacteria bacterium]|jgi:hypothetical protein|nr:hypothetical protein [Gammaproteobacteria bacterium]
MSSLNSRVLVRSAALLGLGLLLAGCETRPEIRAQAAVHANLASYRTYAFMPKPGTDNDGYKTLTTQALERSVGREMLARGYSPAGGQPDLLINFSVKTKDKVEGETGPAFAFGYGWGGGHYGYGFGLGDYYNSIQTVTEGSLMVDLIDREHNEVVWSGTAVGRQTRKALDNPDPEIERSVAEIFARYPIKAAGQTR